MANAPLTIPTASNTQNMPTNRTSIALNAKRLIFMIPAQTLVNPKHQVVSTQVVIVNHAFNLLTTIIRGKPAGFLAARNTV